MHELWNLGTYTRELKRRLPAECFRPVPGRLWWMVLYVGVVAAGIAGIALAGLPLAVDALLALLIGLGFAGLGFMAHDILHGSVVAHPGWRNFLGGVCFVPFCVGAKLWRKWHVVEHHGHTQDKARDPDTMGTLGNYRARGAMARFFGLPMLVQGSLFIAGLAGWFTLHSSMMLRRYYRTFPEAERRVVLAQFLGPWALWLTLLALIGPANFALAFVAPLLIGNWVVMSYISTNHMLNPLTPINDPLVNALSLRIPRWRSILHLGFNYHVEHHIFPSMSPRYAAEVQRLAKELWPDRYQELTHRQALRGLWRTPRAYHDDEHLIELRHGRLYPVLGSGFDPERIVGRPAE